MTMEYKPTTYYAVYTVMLCTPEVSRSSGYWMHTVYRKNGLVVHLNTISSNSALDGDLHTVECPFCHSGRGGIPHHRRLVKSLLKIIKDLFIHGKSPSYLLFIIHWVHSVQIIFITPYPSEVSC